MFIGYKRDAKTEKGSLARAFATHTHEIDDRSDQNIDV